MNLRLATSDDKPRLIEMAARFLIESRYGADFDHKATPDKIADLIENVLVLGAIVVATAPLPEPWTVDPCDACYGVDSCCGDCPCCPRLVGMLAIVAIPHPMTGQIYAEEIAWWVEPDYRGGTLGPKMLRAAEDWATTNGANVIKMVAPAGSTVGSFYERIGYTPVETAFIKRI